MDDNKLSLIVSVDSKQAERDLGGFNAQLSVAEKSAFGASGGFSRMDRAMVDSAKSTLKSREQMEQASRTLEMMGSKLGVVLPEGARKYVASLAGVAPALSAAFSATAIVAVGVALFEGGKRLYDWVDGAKAAAAATNEFNKSIMGQIDAQAELRKRIDQFDLSGSGLSKDNLKRAQDQLDVQQTIFNDLRQKKEALAITAAETTIRPGRGQMAGYDYQVSTPAAIAAGKELGDTTMAIAKQAQVLRTATLVATEAGMAYDKLFGEERAKAAEDFNDKLNKGVRATVRALKEEALEFSKAQDDFTKSYLAGVDASAKNAAEMAAFQKSAMDAYYGATTMGPPARPQSPEESVKAGIDANQRYALETIKQYKDVTSAAEKAAEEGARQFERTAQSIEGFFDRVFMSAKSFGGMWKNLWREVIGSAVTSASRLLAATMTGGRQMAGAGAGGMGGGSGILGGLLGGFGGMIPMGGGGGGYPGTPPFAPGAGAGAAGGAGGIGAAGIASAFNLAALKSFIGMGPGGSVVAPGTGGLTVPGGGFSMSGLAKSNAAAMGGAMLLMDGLRRGGKLGVAESAGGGALLGFKYSGGNPLGALIGGIAGAAAGLVRMMIKGATDKAREKIKAVYGVDIQDKAVLKQIVDMARQNFGSNLDMCIRAQEARDLIELYALSHGQNATGMPAKMTSTSFMQQGGNLFLQPTYSNGSPVGGGARGGVTVYTTVNIAGAKEFLETGTLTTVSKNPRVIQAATGVAMKSNFGRRESVATQLSPGTLVS